MLIVGIDFALIVYNPLTARADQLTAMFNVFSNQRQVCTLPLIQLVETFIFSNQRRESTLPLLPLVETWLFLQSETSVHNATSSLVGILNMDGLLVYWPAATTLRFTWTKAAPGGYLHCSHHCLLPTYYRLSFDRRLTDSYRQTSTEGQCPN